MKKFILPLLLLLAIGMLAAVESAPSDVVGYVKYDMGIGLNTFALPMETTYDWASEIGDANPGCFDAIFFWDFASQAWGGASDLGGFWDGDFEIASGNVLMSSNIATLSFYSIGELPAVAPVYTLGAGLNTLMLPLNRSDLEWASELGIETTVAEAVFYWDFASQAFGGASDLGGFWDGDFEISIGMPLMVSSLGNATWPTRAASTGTFRSNNK